MAQGAFALNTRPSALLTVPSVAPKQAPSLVTTRTVTLVAPVRAAAAPVGIETSAGALFCATTFTCPFPASPAFVTIERTPAALAAASPYFGPAALAFQHGTPAHMSPARSTWRSATSVLEAL